MTTVKRNIIKNKNIALSFLLALYLLTQALPAVANVMILPIRTVFQDKERTKNIAIINASPKAATFKMSWIYQEQTESGAYKRLDGPPNPEMDFAKIIAFSPRQVVLPESGKQTVKLSLRRPKDIPDGEYRAHLKIENLRNPTIIEKKNPKGAAAVVAMNLNFAFPVMIRQGKYDTTAEISNLKFVAAGYEKTKKIPPKITMTLSRKGKYSSLGKVEVYWAPSQGGEEKLVGKANNVNIFPEITHRDINVSLTDMEITGGKFRVVYAGDDADKDKTFDEKSFNG